MQLLAHRLRVLMGICLLLNLFSTSLPLIPTSVYAFPSSHPYINSISQDDLLPSQPQSPSTNNEKETNHDNSDLTDKPFPTARTIVIVVVAISIFVGFALFVYMNRDRDRK